MTSDRSPWTLYIEGASKVMGTATSRTRLIKIADREFRGRKALISHRLTDETWERRGGSWIMTAPAKPLEQRKPEQRKTEASAP